MSRQIMSAGQKLVVSQPQIADLASFTWACWVFPNTNVGFGTNTPGMLSRLNAAGAEKKKLRVTGATAARKIIGEVSRGTTGAVTTSASFLVVTGSWQHLAMTYAEPDGIRLYKDGAEVAYANRVVGVGATDPDVGGSLVMGASQSGLTLDGRLAEVAIWNRVLTAGELAVLGVRRYSPLLVRAGLLAAWRLLGMAAPESDALGGPAAVPVGTAPAEHPPGLVAALPERIGGLGQMRGQMRRM